MSEAVRFAILDVDSGNAVSFFDSELEAETALRRTVQEMPEERDRLMLVSYDKLGDALRAVLASRLPALT